MTKVIESHPELDELLKEFKTETVAEEALRILESIPDKKWIIEHFCNGKDSYCAMGHMCNFFGGNILYHDLEVYRASQSFQHEITMVNDGADMSYQQPTPKQRVIALLHDMIKAGY